MMTTNLYLFRHGKVNNPKKISYDSTMLLSKEGEEQMLKVGKVLKSMNLKPAIIITSPYDRAFVSAQMIGKSFPNTKILIDERLHDNIAPSLVGKPISYIHELKDIYTNPLVNRYGMESREEIVTRMTAAINAAVNNYKGKEIIMVSHGDPTALVSYQLLNPEKEFPPIGSIINTPDYLKKGEGWKFIFDDNGLVVKREAITS